ncbi:PEP/pyruvate-binding domain-containing protein [Olsenella sp. kh2p3]|uniref:PEP/pyruvate-binding domain-containing protein n=1 Tax=Olsenella sp. kh2p3 TaxID=1797112 RepID=UPI00091E2031|nr:PEP/pyruvate-binding domain-containing protein [Olsenella sp. kh2p3]SFX00642.1 Pyruvate phosphate dikinase, PEP/pyruvate binding domain [Olsenella sp. kh2p3]
MAAFDRVPSGIDGLDKVLDSIRLGDNVVWQVSSLDEFRPIADAFVGRSVADGRNVIYLRFASHRRIIARGTPGVVEVDLDPRKGFETFTMQVHDVITREGPEAFYVFDSLSDLQVAWSADLTMGNFFRLTCPYLFSLDTVAYFPIIKGDHSFAAIAKIHDTTQLLIDVSPDEGGLFIHPLKVWRRYSPTMFLAHRLDLATGEVRALTSGVDTSRFYARMSEEMNGAADRDIDSWDRFFLQARASYQHGEDMRENCRKMCNMMMTRDPRMRTLVQKYFSPTDYFDVRRRMVGTGMVGGKSCGMLLSRKIVEKNLPELVGLLEPHDSFYVGTDVFYTFIVENDLWPLRIAQRGDDYLRVADALAQGIENGIFPPEIEQGFRRILDYFGQVPIIVRSSSCLEDAFGNAFAGKYDSVFLPNVGDPEERLREFERAVKRVYASTMNPSALEYRRRNGLDTAEEEMALLVQRVSGSRYGDAYFMPTAAGIGYSRSAYCWLPDMDPSAGMLRLVMGLGTKAVDRTERDYPRLVSLDRPNATTMVTDADRHRFCQRGCDLIDLAGSAFAEKLCTDIAPLMPASVRPMVMEHDREAERMLRDRGQRREVTFASCAGLAGDRRFTTAMRKILRALQEAYDYAVDIEFTVNVDRASGEETEPRFVINLLQCRPLQSFKGTGSVEVPAASGPVLLRAAENTMGASMQTGIDFVCVVDAAGYRACPHGKRPGVARAVGEAARKVREAAGATAVLLVPGRIGTSSPDLGVPVTFAEIAAFRAIVEYADAAHGFSPELSYGSHMFQDLVEQDILYCAALERGATVFDRGVLSNLPQVGLDAATADPDIAACIRLYDARGRGLGLWHDFMSGKTLMAFA